MQIKPTQSVIKCQLCTMSLDITNLHRYFFTVDELHKNVCSDVNHCGK